MSTCSLGFTEMSSSCAQQRKGSKQNGEDRSEATRQAEDSDPGIVQSLLPCMAGVAGISLLIWVLFFLYIPPSIIKGNSLCTRLADPATLRGDLQTLSDWRSFAVELGVSSVEIESIENKVVDKKEKIEQVLRLWEEKAGTPCWEKLISTLKKLDETVLAENLATKRKPIKN